MTISEQLAHLQGLAEGMEIASETSKEARLLTAMLEVLSSVVGQVNELKEDIELLSDQADSLEYDIAWLGESVFGGDEDDDVYVPDEYDEDSFDDFDDEDDVVYEVTCPKCGETLLLNEDTILAGNIRCSFCRQLFSLEVLDEDDEDESADYDEDESED